MDRRAKKLEKKRKSRDQTKKSARALATRESQKLSLLARSAGSAEFGPCYVSDGWDDLTTIALGFNGFCHRFPHRARGGSPRTVTRKRTGGRCFFAAGRRPAARSSRHSACTPASTS
jgi:hypothetical protein